MRKYNFAKGPALLTPRTQQQPQQVSFKMFEIKLENYKEPNEICYLLFEISVAKTKFLWNPAKNVIFFLKFIFAETKALAEKQAKEAMAMAQAKCSLQ